MKKKFALITISIISLSVLGGCTANTSASSPSTPSVVSSEDLYSESYTNAYHSLISFKSKDYEELTVKEFNESLISDDDSLTSLLEYCSTVKEKLPGNDTNYDFIMITLSASIDELYSKQLGDEITYFCHLKKTGNPVEPLNENEQELFEQEPLYSFFFSADCVINYKIIDDTITVEERDNILKTIHSTLQSYIDNLDETELAKETISDLLSQKATETLLDLKTSKLEINCTIDNVSFASENKAVEG